MGGFDIALILIGIICGNLGAVFVRPFNLGLLWNSVWGGSGAGGLIFYHTRFTLPFPDFWGYEFLAAGAAGMALMLTIGAMTAFGYRD